MADQYLYGMTRGPLVGPLDGRWVTDGFRSLRPLSENPGLRTPGGIGMRFDTGVIVVTAHTDRVDVTADRLIVYGGAFTTNPGGTPFDVTLPTVSLDGRTLQIPIGVSSHTPQVASLAASDTEIDLGFDSPVDAHVVTPANTGAIVTASSPVQSGANGIKIPISASAIVEAIRSISVISPVALRVVFVSDMDPVAVGNAANYAISPTLRVISVTVVSSTVVLLNTDLMADGTHYTLTISGV